MRHLGTPTYKIYENPVSFPPTILCVDNAAAIAMSKNAKMTKKTRHIDCHFHFVRDGVARNLHSLHWISNLRMHSPKHKSPAKLTRWLKSSCFHYRLSCLNLHLLHRLDPISISQPNSRRGDGFRFVSEPGIMCEFVS